MSRAKAIAEIKAAGCVPVLSEWLKARSPTSCYVTTIHPPYWEAKPGQVKACAEAFLVRIKEQEAIFASGDREAIKAYMRRIYDETHSLDI